MNKKQRIIPTILLKHKYLLVFLFILSACSNSNDIDYDNTSNSFSSHIDDLPLDDSEYPYAGIPRIVIETENYREIKDRETEIPAKLQIWGAKDPESELMDLTIKGRGNTSWTEMPKKSYKIEFINKQEILGMSKEKDWVLLANHADKTLIKNLIAFQLSFNFKNYYTPQHKFVELYLNQNYLGVYQLCEAIKISRNRINSFHPDSVFLAEIDHKYKAKDQMILSSSG